MTHQYDHYVEFCCYNPDCEACWEATGDNAASYIAEPEHDHTGEQVLHVECPDCGNQVLGIVTSVWNDEYGYQRAAKAAEDEWEEGTGR